ncbi:NAD(P)-binding domain-containing protein [Pseudaminobacter sp. 19-2017]|uniref:Pyrroline-5-carboxylate reductase n=1 Tax=Pseudaminobacter soli (ex Zhang et al. 2022) TaxID=2831468 RepID=A0A942DZB6_9HYPH|nr:pyrroline-5-carboxylate reductase dimerization domain-containing protein [Pseudaminobacter soli]MBS3650188.1 NAD(P)-binding domain-containing protein [Pseudaminobacter soli]
MVDVGRVGIIGGAGWLGTAMAKALVGSGTVTAERLICSFRSRKPENSVECAWTQDNRQLVERSDVVILSVRPGDWNSIDVDAAGKLVISVMAGVTVGEIGRRTGSARVARALPNAAAEIGYSYTPFFLSSSEPQDQDIVSTLFRSCGEVDAVTKEEHIDYFTAMTGSGAAFPALLADAMTQDAIGRGVPSDVARRAAQQVIIGAGRLQEHNGASATETVKSYVDYKGTTAAGILAMRDKGFNNAVVAGLDAAFEKARALSVKSGTG